MSRGWDPLQNVVKQSGHPYPPLLGGSQLITLSPTPVHALAVTHARGHGHQERGGEEGQCMVSRQTRRPGMGPLRMAELR